MHEAALFRELRRGVDRAAAAEGADWLLGVEIWIGALCHVREPMLREAWPEIVQGTAAEGSRLVVLTSTDPSDPAADTLLIRSITVPVATGPRPTTSVRL